MLDIRKLKTLREVALRQSFSAAAANLGYTQPAISQQIAQLERQAGTALLDRRGRNLRLTPAGKALVDCADAVLRRLVDAEAELEAITGTRQGDLRLSVMADAMGTWLPGVLRGFLRSHPSVRIRVCVQSATVSQIPVDANEIDISVVEWRGSVSLPHGMAEVALFDEPLRVLLPQRHRALGAAPDVRALLAESWILPTTSSAAADTLHALWLREGMRPRLGPSVDDPLAVHGMVAAGLGVALLPASVAELPVREDVVAVALEDPEPIRSVAALVRAGIERSPAVTGMLAELRQSAGHATTSGDLDQSFGGAGHYESLSRHPGPSEAWTAQLNAG